MVLTIVMIIHYIVLKKIITVNVALVLNKWIIWYKKKKTFDFLWHYVFFSIKLCSQLNE